MGRIVSEVNWGSEVQNIITIEPKTNHSAVAKVKITLNAANAENLLTICEVKIYKKTLGKFIYERPRTE